MYYFTWNIIEHNIELHIRLHIDALARQSILTINRLRHWTLKPSVPPLSVIVTHHEPYDKSYVVYESYASIEFTLPSLECRACRLIIRIFAVDLSVIPHLHCHSKKCQVENKWGLEFRYGNSIRYGHSWKNFC